MSKWHSKGELSNPKVFWLGIGLAVGAGFGVAIENVAVGICIGLVIGIAVGNAKKEKQDKIDKD